MTRVFIGMALFGAGCLLSTAIGWFAAPLIVIGFRIWLWGEESKL